MDPTIGQGTSNQVKQAILAEIERYNPE